ncbi:hypothetical protein NFI96_003392 [Prochilodus magdalenae]|nr:hypothetical protein NFI96_003392 [Prochilodus magdalenae]
MLAYKAKIGPAPLYLMAMVKSRAVPRALRPSSTARYEPPSLRTHGRQASRLFSVLAPRWYQHWPPVRAVSELVMVERTPTGCPNSGISRSLQTQTEDPSLRNALEYQHWSLFRQCLSSCRGRGGVTPGLLDSDNKLFIFVLTTVPPHADSLVVSIKTKVGLITEDDPSHKMRVCRLPVVLLEGIIPHCPNARSCGCWFKEDRDLWLSTEGPDTQQERARSPETEIRALALKISMTDQRQPSRPVFPFQNQSSSATMIAACCSLNLAGHTACCSGKS